jgi:hypothetical protein
MFYNIERLYCPFWLYYSIIAPFDKEFNYLSIASGFIEIGRKLKSYGSGNVTFLRENLLLVFQNVFFDIERFYWLFEMKKAPIDIELNYISCGGNDFIEIEQKLIELW